MLLTIHKSTTAEDLVNQIYSYSHSVCSDALIATEVTTVGSEVVYNIIKYGKSGTLSLTTDGKTISLDAEDIGDGFADYVEQALQDGYSTSGSLGLGLPSLFRLCNHVIVETSLRGTKIHCEIGMQ